jgi:hypothetical protein
MLTILGAMTAAGGLFLILWYRTVVSLPVQQQPGFIHPAAFKWGTPLLALLLFLTGVFLLAAVNPWLALAGAGIAFLSAAVLVKFDRYTADIRVIYDHYLKIRAANPAMEDIEVLFYTAQWRYPGWNHDRIVELVAGKEIQSLILLMLISENKINPISDWELYRSMKVKIGRIVRPG